MTSSQSRPETLTELRYGAGSWLAIVAGLQLALFTTLKGEPMTVEQNEEVDFHPDIAG